MDQKRTKWRLDGYAWVISKIEKIGDLDEMLEMVPTKFERKRAWGKHLTRNNKHYVQNEWDSGRQEEEEEEEVRILIRRMWTKTRQWRRSSLQLEMQSCQNDVRAMTPCFYVSNERASLGLSRAICTKSVASVILEIGRAKERHQQWPWWDGTMPTKFERNWDRGKNLERARKHCVHKPMGFGACLTLQSSSLWGPKAWTRYAP